MRYGRSCRFPVFVALSCCAGERCLGLEGWRHAYEVGIRSISPTKIWVWLFRNAVFRLCGVRQNFHELNFYRNHDQDDRIFDWLLTSMAAVQAEDVGASFMLVYHLIDVHYQEWFGSTHTNRHVFAAFDFATVSGCDQLVVGPTHARPGAVPMCAVVVGCCCADRPLCRLLFRWLRLFQTCVLVGNFT